MKLRKTGRASAFGPEGVRVTAFASTDPEMILRATGIETLVLAGIATSGVVLSTVRSALPFIDPSDAPRISIVRGEHRPRGS